jgi:hypothetical protein
MCVDVHFKFESKNTKVVTYAKISVQGIIQGLGYLLCIKYKVLFYSFI